MLVQPLDRARHHLPVSYTHLDVYKRQDVVVVVVVVLAAVDVVPDAVEVVDVPDAVEVLSLIHI